MKYKALVTFSGRITKGKDEIFEINDKELAKDLLNAKFIEEVGKKSKKVSLNKEDVAEDTEKNEETNNEDKEEINNEDK